MERNTAKVCCVLLKPKDNENIAHVPDLLFPVSGQCSVSRTEMVEIKLCSRVELQMLAQNDSQQEIQNYVCLNLTKKNKIKNTKGIL